MRTDGRRSSHVEDRRGRGAAGGAIGVGGIIVAVIYVLLGGDPRDAAKVATAVSQVGDAAQGASSGGAPPADDALAGFVSVVLADTEDVWTKLFAEQGGRYPPPTLVLFTGAVASACGRQGAAVGPFYCPADQKAYIDLSFYDALRRRFGAPGDFAQAYVIAHEVGHHVQNVLGTSAQVDRQGRGRSEAEVNALSVRQELQADCYAGLWAHHAHADRGVIEPGDVDEALTAAQAIGDDTLQQHAGGAVRVESFTHGSAAMRQRWFEVGLRAGRLDACDTFAVAAADVGL